MPLPSLALNFCPFFSTSVASGMLGLAPTVWGGGEVMGKHTSKPSYCLQFPPEGSASPAANRNTTCLAPQKKERKMFWNNVFAMSVLVPIPKEGK